VAWLSNLIGERSEILSVETSQLGGVPGIVVENAGLDVLEPICVARYDLRDEVGPLPWGLELAVALLLQA